MDKELKRIASAVFRELYCTFDDCPCTQDQVHDEEVIVNAILAERERCANIAEDSVCLELDESWKEEFNTGCRFVAMKIRETR